MQQLGVRWRRWGRACNGLARRFVPAFSKTGKSHCAHSPRGGGGSALRTATEGGGGGGGGLFAWM